MHCIDQPFTISKLWVNRNAIQESPEYQRESAIWSIERKQLFVDSILNRFDVPKLYFHDLRANNKSIHEYAVVDGKQRLHAIYAFLQDQFPLASDFSLMEQRPGQEAPKAGAKFSELSEFWREEFKATSLSVVLIQNAADEDIEELFSRLNNGEPLNAAEKRNAMGGDMCRLIRTVASDDFFRTRMKVSNKRYQHYELSAKFLLLERTAQSGGGAYADLKKRFLDNLVKSNKAMNAADFSGLEKRVTDQLKVLSRIFSDHDALLSKQAYPPLYYIFVKRVMHEYGHPALASKLRKFLEDFHAMRSKNLELPEDDRDPVLIEFGRLMQQGTNDLNSLRDRTSILTRYFLLDNPDVSVKDQKRLFTDEERLAIWILGGKKCASCGIEIGLDDMHADHQDQWAHGGQTTLKNGRCLCKSCNTALAKPVS